MFKLASLFLTILTLVFTFALFLVDDLNAYIKDARTKGDINLLSKEAEYYYLFRQNYPESLDKLIKEEGLKNVPGGYDYLPSDDGQRAILFAKLETTGNLWCWRSETGKIVELDSVCLL